MNAAKPPTLVKPIIGDAGAPMMIYCGIGGHCKRVKVFGLGSLCLGNPSAILDMSAQIGDGEVYFFNHKQGTIKAKRQ